jgi:hypothetical protein
VDPLLDKVVARALGGREPAPGVRLHQRGEIRLAPGRTWSRFRAEQVIEARRTSFRWTASVRMAPLCTVKVVDAYEDGCGRLDARLWGLVRVAHGTGPAIDRGELLRYLAELPWCPFAFVANPALRVRSEDDRLVVGIGDVEARLTVDAQGDVVAADALRPRDVGGDSVETRWRGTFSDHGDLGGFRGPRKGVVAWQLDDGPFEYWRGEIIRAEAG